jgi:tetratricopeptide (TPR) repeat protein
MSFRHVTVFLLMMMVAVLPTFGQGRSAPRITFSIAGSVRDDYDQHTLENVRVDLKQSTGIPLNTTYTRGNGEFEFAGLSNGEYSVEVVLEGYEPYRDTVTIYNAARRGVAIFLRRPLTVVSTRPPGSISAHELSVPRKAHDEFEKGLSLLYSKMDYRGAIVQFQRAIKDFPTFYEAYAQEGGAYLNLKEMPAAEEALRKSIELSSGQYPDAIFLLGGLLNNTQRFADAVTISRQGINADSAGWRGYYELARALTGLKQLEEAEKNAIQSRDLKPDNPSIYLILANIHIQGRNYPALLKDLEGYLKLVPNGPDADQARKTQGELQAAMRQEQEQSRRNDQSSLGAQGQPRSNDSSDSATNKPPEQASHPSDQGGRQPSEREDPPLLPPLPPPEAQ